MVSHRKRAAEYRTSEADKQGRHILEWFITTDYDWLVTLDSDLIVRPDWLELLRGMLPHTWGADSQREKSVGFPMDKLSPDVRGRAELFLKG